MTRGLQIHKPFGMKKAIQQSTKLAINNILREFIRDINANRIVER